MLRKLWLNYGATVIIVLTIVAVFMLGFIFGRYGRSAPSLEIAENELRDSAGNTVSVETLTEDTEEQPTEETPQPTALDVIATAYCPCEDCSGGWGNKTSTGATATAGRTIAVDPTVIPYGTEVTIDGHTYIAEDCGAAIKGNKVDIYFDTHEQAKQFGKQQKTVYFFK